MTTRPSSFLPLSLLFYSFFFFFFGLFSHQVSATGRPIIGILTEPTFPEHQPFGQSYIPLDYVQWIESAGARVAPIKFDLPLPQLEKLFNKVNGLVFIGGDAAINTSTVYEKAASFLVNLAVKSYANGDYFPVWGTCLGLELISILITNNNNILDTFDAENITLPLNFTAEAATSRLFGGPLATRAVSILSKRAMTMNWHTYGVTPQAYKNDQAMFNFFSVLTTNLDRKGKEFISTMEGRDVPVYATQWHPERNQFDWSLAGEPLDHSLEAIEATQYLANKFVDEARKNNHQFDSVIEEDQHLIYRYTPVFSAPTVDNFYSKIFFFD